MRHKQNERTQLTNPSGHAYMKIQTLTRSINMKSSIDYLLLLLLCFLFNPIALAQSTEVDDRILGDDFLRTGEVIFPMSCRAPHGAVKQIHTETLNIGSGASDKKYLLNYTSSTSIEFCEHRECGPFGCSRVCDVSVGPTYLHRSLSVEKNDVIIGERIWTLAEKKEASREKDNCNSVSHNVGKYVNNELKDYDGYKQNYIEPDRNEVMRLLKELGK